MVHPSQQRAPFGQRRSRPVITVARNGKVRSFRINSWAAGLALGGFALFLTVYVAATAYLIYRDDLLGGTLARQVAMQYSYEDRIAALRAEIDRVTSRHVVDTQGVEEQLAVLLERQAVIARRQLALDELVDKARDTGIDVAEAVRLPRARPAAAADAPAPSSNSAPLAYVPAGQAQQNPIIDTLIRGSSADRQVELRDNLGPLLTDVQASLDQAQHQQSDALDVLDQATQSEVDRLSAALAPLGIGVEAGNGKSPTGGPFIPAEKLHFVERTALLNRLLDDIANLRRSAAAMPLAAPVAARSISSRFGYRMDPFLNRPALHAGLDFVAPAGTEVRATAPGLVVSAGAKGGYGQMVEIRHEDGVNTRYAHLSAILVEKGTRVSSGTPIGRVGSTGRSTGPHLHYETRRNGEPINPALYLAAGRAL
jgi:murein DD-endopeptidase MepM/ murein hydrolase activator NlpD